MAPGNKSKPSEFTVQGFADSAQLQLLLFIIFLSIYLTIILSNFTVIVYIVLDSHLQSPMYILLCNLSIIDISYTSTILPKLLAMLFTHRRVISYNGCIAQLYFFMFFGCTEIILLAVMAYDRYAAICHPLHYYLLMSSKRCAQVASTVWTVGLLVPITHIILTSDLTFCFSNQIDHFFCDLTPLLKISCTDTSIIEIWNYIAGTIVSVNAFFLTLISYMFIISAILNIRSSFGRRKAFSTCASHVTCVIIFYGTMICMYLRPTSSHSAGQDKVFALLYIVLIPLLNPIIYTIKNEDFKNVFKKINKTVFGP
uniref:Olfactory receptor n=1 Tax=Leptobrachium leishanense TaxID=445787 RepID=A0A8C5PAI1_9ANUR